MKKYVVFRLGAEEFGMEISNVVEILNALKISIMPEMPDFISGVVTVRGDVIPLLDMRLRFNIKPEPKKERIIIVKIEREKVGFIVDEVMEILSFAESEMRATPSIFKGLKAEYISGLGKREGRVIILLNLDLLLSSKERILLQQSSETARP